MIHMKVLTASDIASIRTGKLFASKSLCHVFIFWFHVSTFGGHVRIQMAIRGMQKMGLVERTRSIRPSICFQQFVLSSTSPTAEAFNPTLRPLSPSTTATHIAGSC